LTAHSVWHTVCDVQCMGNGMKDSDSLAGSASGSLFENLRLELRRGCLTLATLAQLKQEHYGYTLRKALAERGLAIDESTLYPLLRRLESQGLLLSQWREEDKRNKRFYRLSPMGEQMLGQLLAEWRELNASLDRILGQREGQAE